MRKQSFPRSIQQTSPFVTSAEIVLHGLHQLQRTIGYVLFVEIWTHDSAVSTGKNKNDHTVGS